MASKTFDILEYMCIHSIKYNVNTPESASVVYKHTEKSSLYHKKTRSSSRIYMDKNLRAKLR